LVIDAFPLSTKH